MYFADFRGPVPPLPTPVQVERLPDRGTLITLTQERFTASNPAHVALAADVQRRLQDAGMLTPLRPWGT
ncbi:Imm52 family immunity protein [Corallococcus silvisoli]|uniref:Imm52 family immunity protein n=1 Tax=Corallococcus silvisoli TaxID=2697031 RepID=UPI001F2A4169|nr:Imm52 family immunity protein [Corallococcus silvisoli]